jgi:hypothetical protein
LPRIAITFRLSGTSQQQDLLHEFELHEGVAAQAIGSDDQSFLIVETSDTQAALWEVRSTVGLFDDAAVEVPDPADNKSA